MEEDKRDRIKLRSLIKALLCLRLQSPAAAEVATVLPWLQRWFQRQLCAHLAAGSQEFVQVTPAGEAKAPAEGECSAAVGAMTP